MYRITHSLFGTEKYKSESLEEIENFIINEAIECVTSALSSAFSVNKLDIHICKKYIVRVLMDAKTKFRKIYFNDVDITKNIINVLYFQSHLYKSIYMIKKSGERVDFGRIPSYYINPTQESLFKRQVDFEVESIEYEEISQRSGGTGGVMVLYSEDQFKKILDGIYNHKRTKGMIIEGRDFNTPENN
ncbi:hypothetical protein CPT_Privateer_078 [Proteus phage Privateer]|uniref:Uncharacterized protein n=1 Tax=Proteus phage Privateer TaxID=2712958 RepID=A0A6G8R3X5_9CAUD|nr:hypothetical protein HWD17_gp078 [Proteus phage Privateer]QIN94871.1 hypothetical protein CPT_Privateer_078 [Proteus phage Privateer]